MKRGRDATRTPTVRTQQAINTFGHKNYWIRLTAIEVGLEVRLQVYLADAGGEAIGAEY